MTSSNGPPRHGRVLITGAAGFIGSHVAERFLREGFEVVGLDNFDTYYSPAVKRANVAGLTAPGFELVDGDIRDVSTLRLIFASGPFDAVVHLAARAGVRPSLSDPDLYVSVNIAGTSTLLSVAASQAGIHFVFGSSSSVYGATTPAPFREDAAADNPSSPYAASKRSGEVLSYAFHHIHGIPVTCLRFFTVYGPRQRPEMAIHRFTRDVVKGTPIAMFGNGSSVRDYTFVDDIVDGVFRASLTPAGYRIFNLGSSHTTSLRSLIDLIGSTVGTQAIIDELPMQLGDVPLTQADISRARAELGYEPRTTIEQGVPEFVRWYLHQTDDADR